MVAVLRSFATRPRLATLGRVAALWVALLAVSALVPHAPVFVARNFDIRTANLWESMSAQLAASKKDAGGPPGFEQSQRSLLQAEVASLFPPTKGTTNIYALGIAGSSSAGLQEFAFEGGDMKATHLGRAAQLGLESALLAAAGVRGPSTVLEGPFGYFN